MIKTILIFIWTLPQSLIGWIISVFCEESRAYGRVVYYWNLSGALSLGLFVFVPKDASKFTVSHEYGHSRQSLCLGWLYLIVIGLPSFLWASLQTIGLFRDVCYYDFYTERWANKIAGYTCYLDRALRKIFYSKVKEKNE